MGMELLAGINPKDPHEDELRADERLERVKRHLASKGIACKPKGISRRHESGVTCVLRMDEDDELIAHFLEKRKQDRDEQEAKADCDGGSGSDNAMEDIEEIVERLEEWCDTKMHF